MTYGPEGADEEERPSSKLPPWEIPSPVNISASLTLTYRANSKGEGGGVGLPGPIQAVYGLLLPQACIPQE